MPVLSILSPFSHIKLPYVPKKQKFRKEFPYQIENTSKTKEECVMNTTIEFFKVINN
jgi:hypothetical protein